MINRSAGLARHNAARHGDSSSAGRPPANSLGTEFAGTSICTLQIESICQLTTSALVVQQQLLDANLTTWAALYRAPACVRA
jgi:hypothetical protein